MFQLKTSLVSQNKSMMLFLITRTSTTVSFQMLGVAVGWQMYSLTEMPLYLGLVGLVQFLPMFLLTLVIGYVADRYDRKLIICFCQIIESMSIFLLAYGSYKGWITKEGILIIMFIIGTAFAFQGPPMQALLPNIVSKEHFPQAAALSASANQVAVILGPALGGLLYSIGAEIVYSASCILLMFTVVSTFFISIRQEQSKTEAITINSLFGGVFFIKSRPVILGAISLDMFAVLFGGATALLPVYASKVLEIGSFGLGLLNSAPAVGALLMSVYLARKPLKRKVGYIMFAAVILFGISTIVFALSTSLMISLIALFFLGASNAISVVIRHTLVQIGTPDNMRGRVSSVNLMFIGTSNQLGAFESGLTAAWFGAVPAVMIGGIGTIAVVLLWMKLFPELLHVDRLEPTYK